MSKQNFYKEKRVRQRQAVEEELILDLVRAERRLQPALGTRKLLVLIGAELAEADVTIGRDRMFGLLGEHHLLIARRRRGCQTTDSRHGLRVWPNLLKDAVLSAPHQGWVSDLTYLRTWEGFMYLALVMDAWSRKIVGWHVGQTLEAIGCLEALRMALGQLPRGLVPIHHSDRGTQYCCEAYVNLLKDSKLRISMTEQNHCYENAKAERLNGILKQEYGLGAEFIRKADVAPAVRQAVQLYNHRRPHQMLGMRFPAAVHGAMEAAA